MAVAEHSSSGDDPFTVFLQPPANESVTERAARELREAKDKKRSEAIDLELKKKKQMKTRNSWELPSLKAVLIGDPESGASYVLI